MTRSTFFNLTKLLAVLAVSAFLMIATTGCNGGGDDGGSGGGGDEQEAAAADMTGTWQGIIIDAEAVEVITMQLTQTGNAIVGTIIGSINTNGTVTGTINAFAINLNIDDAYSTAANGVLNPDNTDLATGTWTNYTGSGTWSVERTSEL